MLTPYAYIWLWKLFDVVWSVFGFVAPPYTLDAKPPFRRCWVNKVLADALTLGLMCYATFLEPDDDDDNDRLELVYAGALLVQVL